MDSDLQDKLTGYLDNLESGLKSAGDFAAEQIPDVVQQWLAWQMWSSLFYVVVFALLIAMAIGIARKLYRSCEGMTDYDREFTRLWINSIAAIVVIVLLVICIANARNAIKVAVAPKVVVLEKIVDLAKTVRR